jgi:hypothetical protein
MRSSGTPGGQLKDFLQECFGMFVTNDITITSALRSVPEERQVCRKIKKCKRVPAERLVVS